MTTLAARRLGPPDAAAAVLLLDEDPIASVYLRSELRLGSLRTGTWWGAGEGPRLRALLCGGALVVPWLPDPGDAAVLAGALGRQAPPRMIVGVRAQVHALQDARRPRPAPRERRDPQPVMALGRGDLRVDGSREVRRGTLADLEALTAAAAAMHREEMGVDPMVIDPVGWRTRMRSLIERGWSWVWSDRGEIVFKTELSAWTPDAVQLQGVYTAPAARSRGVATAGLAAVCEALLREVPVVSLYVNHFNTPALRVYDRLGFTTHGEFATLMF